MIVNSTSFFGCFFAATFPAEKVTRYECHNLDSDEFLFDWMIRLVGLGNYYFCMPPILGGVKEFYFFDSRQKEVIA